MQNIIDFISRNREGMLATIDNGKPRVRPFQFQYVVDGSFYFCTGRSKQVFRQLTECPSIEFSSMSRDMMTFVRLEGDVILDDNQAVKEKIIAENRLVASIYTSADNPEFTTFCLKRGKATLVNLLGNTPHVVTF